MFVGTGVGVAVGVGVKVLVGLGVYVAVGIEVAVGWAVSVRLIAVWMAFSDGPEVHADKINNSIDRMISR